MNWQNYFFSGIDNRVSEYLHAAASMRATEFFSIVTYLGNWRLIVVLSVLVIFFFWKYGNKGYIIPFVATLIGGQLTGTMLKRIFERPRPEWGIYPDGSFSFPSGHAIVSVLFYGFLAYLVFKISKRRSTKIIFLALGALIILVIGFSRLYLGEHYLSDVLAGYIIGLIWVSVGFIVHNRYFRK